MGHGHTHVEVMVTVFADSHATMAVAVTGDGISVTASSRREPGDRGNPAIGEDLAVARALGKISRKLERRANGAVRQAEYVKMDRRRRAANPDPVQEEINDALDLVTGRMGPQTMEEIISLIGAHLRPVPRDASDPNGDRAILRRVYTAAKRQVNHKAEVEHT